MRQLSSPFRIFTLTSRRVWPPGDAGAQRSSRPCWYSLGNAENLRRRFRGQPEGAGFLADWDDEVIIGRLQEYLGTASGRGVGTAATFPSSGGSGPAALREAGEGGQLPGGDVPGLCQPVGTGIGGQGCICPRVGPRTKTGVRRRVCRRDRQGYRREMVGRAQRRRLDGSRRTAFGMSGPGGLGDVVLLDVPSGFTVWPPEPGTSDIRDSGVPANPGCETVSAGPWSSAATSCRRRPGVRLRWPREARDHAATFSAPRGCDRPAGASPAKSTGPSTAGTWTAANPAKMLRSLETPAASVGV